MVGQCSCGLFHGQGNTSCLSMLFSSMPDHKSYEETTNMYSFTSSSPPPSSVDCTLSLGTPSTRLSDQDDQRSRYMSNFCWDIWQSKSSSSSTYAPPPTQQQSHRTTTSRGNNNSSSSGGSNSTNDPLLARRCANCDTTSTPLWRNGPRGPKSLCNACGIRFKKEERRANASASGSGSGSASSSGMVMEQQQQNYNSWVNQSQKVPCYSQANEFRFIEESSDLDYSSADHNNTGIPFLSWRLNVTDRPTSLVHDFTR